MWLLASMANRCQSGNSSSLSTKEPWKRPPLKDIVRIARKTIASKMTAAHARKTIASKMTAAHVRKTIAARVHKAVSQVDSQVRNKVPLRVHVSTTTQQIAIAIATVVVVKDVVTMKAHRAPIATKLMLKFQKIQ